MTKPKPPASGGLTAGQAVLFPYFVQLFKLDAKRPGESVEALSLHHAYTIAVAGLLPRTLGTTYARAVLWEWNTEAAAWELRRTLAWRDAGGLEAVRKRRQKGTGHA